MKYLLPCAAAVVLCGVFFQGALSQQTPQPLNLVVEPGKYEAQIGASSADIRLKGGFEIL